MWRHGVFGRITALVLGAVLVLGSCGADAADGPAGDDVPGALRGDACARPTAVAARNGSTDLRVRVGGIEWTDGDAPSGGHAHSGPLVADGEAHLDYCLEVVNETEDLVELTLVMPLPGDGEEPFALVEAESLATAAGTDADDDGRVVLGPGESVPLLLQVPAGDEPSAIRHRLAYVIHHGEASSDLELIVETESTPIS